MARIAAPCFPPRMLQAWIHTEGLEDCTYLLGYQSESHRINLSLDVATLSSAYGEAFPNVIGEAMASGVPCVVTDVGDAAHIVGSSGLIVPPRDPLALAGAWEELLMRSEQERRQLGLEARQRIVEHFDIVRVAQTYAALYQDIISASPSA